jgi:hypothetical protein
VRKEVKDVGGENFGAEIEKSWAGEEVLFLVHPQNGFNCLVLNWCTGGCWFTPTPLLPLFE